MVSNFLLHDLAVVCPSNFEVLRVLRIHNNYFKFQVSFSLNHNSINFSYIFPGPWPHLPNLISKLNGEATEEDENIKFSQTEESISLEFSINTENEKYLSEKFQKNEEILKFYFPAFELAKYNSSQNYEFACCILKDYLQPPDKKEIIFQYSSIEAYRLDEAVLKGFESYQSVFDAFLMKDVKTEENNLRITFLEPIDSVSLNEYFTLSLGNEDILRMIDVIEKLKTKVSLKNIFSIVKYSNVLGLYMSPERILHQKLL